MKAISLWQPWASLWLGPKIHETRGWATKHRGWLLVHAAQHQTRLNEMGQDLYASSLNLLGPLTLLPYGAIIGAVELVDCEPCDAALRDLLSFDPADVLCGNFADGRFAWRRALGVIRFKKPLPFRGRQRFFDVPGTLDEIAARAAAQ